MQLSAMFAPLTEVSADCLVVGVFEDEAPAGVVATLDAKLGGTIARLRQSGDVSGKVNELVPLFDCKGISHRAVLLVGLGPRDRVDHFVIRDAAAAAARHGDRQVAESSRLRPAGGPAVGRYHAGRRCRADAGLHGPGYPQEQSRRACRRERSPRCSRRPRSRWCRSWQRAAVEGKARRAGPGTGQHAAVRPLSRDVRRAGRQVPAAGSLECLVMRSGWKRNAWARCWPSPRARIGRRGWWSCATAGGNRQDAGPGRQGRHLRQRRPVAEDQRADAGHEVRHGRRRRGARLPCRPSRNCKLPVNVLGVMPWSRTCRAATPSSSATC